MNAHLSDKYHPTIAVSAARWLCCGESIVANSRSSSSYSGGCQPITWTPRQSKCDPVPPLPQDIRSSPMVANNSSTSKQLHASSSQPELEDEVDDIEAEIDSFDLTHEWLRSIFDRRCFRFGRGPRGFGDSLWHSVCSSEWRFPFWRSSS